MADGLATALELLMAENGVSLGTRGAAGGGGAAGEAPDLFGDEPDVPMLVEPIPRGRGRPPGARNRSTEEWRQYLLGRYRSPLVALLEMASRTPKQLANELGLTRRVRVGGAEGFTIEEDDVHAALQAQIAALQAALPYLHSKAPVDVQIKQEGPRGVLVIGELNVNGAGLSDGLRLPDAASVANQQVIDATSLAIEDSRTDDASRTDDQMTLEASDINSLGREDPHEPR